MNVANCMSEDVLLCTPSTSIKDAAQKMKEADAGFIPVGENDRLVGMITDRDIAIRAVAEGKGCQTPVREVMTTEVEYCFEDEDIAEAAAKMGDLRVRRLPVLNRDKRLVGVISIGDIAKGDAASGQIALEQVTTPGGQHRQA